MNNLLLFPSCRVAFAALIHDLGKFTQRAKLPISQEQLNAHKQLYSPFNSEKGFHSHIHAAYTAFSIDQIEKFLPDLIQNDLYPFSSRQQNTQQEITDSLINAAAAHHKPDTFLQWIIATADRVASGFEREEFDEYNSVKEEEKTQLTGKNHYQARLLTLFEQINKTNKNSNQALEFFYPLKALNPTNIFPLARKECEPADDASAQQEYLTLWNQFVEGLKAIPSSHCQKWDLWLDHFDTAYQCVTSSIPSATFGVKPEVSLYDHSKTTAALATALWRWHQENGLTDIAQASQLKNREMSWNEEKFLLIQGDFFGIQDFIFAGGAQTNKKSAKLLRGRSFQVSLFTELAALKILQACQLPSTSQIINAAGKFLIVAPNTAAIKETLKNVQNEFNQWFIQHTYGLIGLGIATQSASCNDFIGNKFKILQQNLFSQLEKIKLQRLDLTDSTQSVQNVQYPYGDCQLNSYFPADFESDEGRYSLISEDQINIGKLLTTKDRIFICDQNADVSNTGKTKALKVPVFGYNVIFTDREEETGKFGQLVKDNKIHRFWDFSLAENVNSPIWNGYARRYINAYVPLFNTLDSYTSEKYQNVEENVEIRAIKTFDFIACEDRILDDKQKYVGQAALMTLKGDVDNLGLLFQQGLQTPTFAKMAALSRQVNQFFSLWLPAFCAEKYPNTYTVFAGGDDFFLIGPWYSIQKLATEMQQAFNRYVANNETIHFSVGMVMTKVGTPVPTLGEMAEEALGKAKGIDAGKNAITIYKIPVKWADWHKLNELGDKIERLASDYSLSTSYLYSLIHFCYQAENKENLIENTMWRSRFYYKTSRYAVDKLAKDEKSIAIKQIISSIGDLGIEKYKAKFSIPLFNYFYQKRN
ncbi:type III-A CRISPR-associated protein Cas10/Csm1 [Pasteurella sp. P03HT]